LKRNNKIVTNLIIKLYLFIRVLNEKRLKSKKVFLIENDNVTKNTK